MRTLYLICEENSDKHFVCLFKELFKKNKMKLDIVLIEGEDETSPKDNNARKSTQLTNLLSNQIKTSDVIFYSNAWNPTILQVKYILSLQNINAKIVGMWGSESLDASIMWIKETEKAVFSALDSNIFLTESNADMFLENLLGINGAKKENYKHYCSNNVVISEENMLDCIINYLR
jgi:hypothetical protein